MGRKYSYENNESNETASSSGGSTGNKLAFLLIGGGIGAAVALLLAPKTGRELRGDIADVTRKGYDKTLETAQQVKEQSGEYYQQVKDQSGTYYQQIKEQAGDAYNTAAEKVRGVTGQKPDAASQTNVKTLNPATDFAAGSTSSGTAADDSLHNVGIDEDKFRQRSI